MCGIVGYIGNKREVKDVLTTSLKRLEYRGYDSAGIATIDESNQAHVTKVVGKIDDLIQAASKEPHSGHIGIGHTRWATHGGFTT